MSDKLCLGDICFAQLNNLGPSLFAFPDFLTALALVALAWTTADVRSRFRVQSAPIDLTKVTFGGVVIIALLTLATDLWRAEGWMVPRGRLLTPATWQALLGVSLLITFLLWAWFAFVRPPVFGRRSASRFARSVYRAILNGSPSDLAVISDEVTRSARALVQLAPEDPPPHMLLAPSSKPAQAPQQFEEIARDILLLIADPRFCRAVVESAPGLALALFSEIKDTRKLRLPIRTFGRNFMEEAMRNKNSFLYHESEGYFTGLMGYHKPLSLALFSDYALVKASGTLFDLSLCSRDWDSDQWSAYSRVALMTFEDFVAHHSWREPGNAFQSIDMIAAASEDLYKLHNSNESAYESEQMKRLRVSVHFFVQALKHLDARPVPEFTRWRVDERKYLGHTIYDSVAKGLFGLITSASNVRSPRDTAWWVQHNLLWAALFRGDCEGVATKIVMFKLRRLIFDAIKELETFPNYLGCKLLGMCLNVLGFTVRPGDRNREEWSLHRAVLIWTRRNMATLNARNPQLVKECFPEGISYDCENSRVLKSYLAGGLRTRTRVEVFLVDVAQDLPAVKLAD